MRRSEPESKTPGTRDGPTASVGGEAGVGDCVAHKVAGARTGIWGGVFQRSVVGHIWSRVHGSVYHSNERV